MTLHYTLILVAAFVQLALGAVWYSPLMFGKQWWKIMESGPMSPDNVKDMGKGMILLNVLQLGMTLATTIALDVFLQAIPDMSPYLISALILVGFIIPMQVAGIIWANTKRKFWGLQSSIMIGFNLVAITLATWILSL